MALVESSRFACDTVKMNDTTAVKVLVKEGGVLLLILLPPLVLLLPSLALWRLFRPNILSLQRLWLESRHLYFLCLLPQRGC